MDRARTAALLATLLVPLGARAAVPTCASATLAPKDEASLRAVAGSVVPKGATFTVIERCVNADAAYAFIATAHEHRDNAEEWWEYTCHRGALNWACADGEHRQLFSAVLADGELQPVQAIAHDSLAPARARRLASDALKIYADPAAHLPECGKASGQSRDWSTFRPRPRLPVPEPLDADVWPKGTQLLVDFNLTLRFVFTQGKDPAAAPALRCWSEVVVAN